MGLKFMEECFLVKLGHFKGWKNSKIGDSGNSEIADKVYNIFLMQIFYVLD